MSSTTHNILIGLLAIVLIGMGYYLFGRESSFELSADAVNPVDDQILLKTQIFIQRRAMLEGVSINAELFADARFNTLQTNTPALPEQPVGKPLLFEVPVGVSDATAAQ